MNSFAMVSCYSLVFSLLVLFCIFVSAQLLCIFANQIEQNVKHECLAECPKECIQISVNGNEDGNDGNEEKNKNNKSLSNWINPSDC